MYNLIRETIANMFNGYLFGNTTTEDIIIEIQKIFPHQIDEKSENKVSFIIGLSYFEFDQYPIDSEGATPYQEKEMEKILSDGIEEVIKVLKKIENGKI
jgi:hypothetical protein